MTRIPDEHEAARALQREFERLARERAPARAARRVRGSLVVALGALLAATAVAVGASGLLEDDPAPTDPRPLPPSAEREPADVRLAVVRVPDPAGGLPWGVRLYTSRLGTPCVFPGQLRGERLGAVRRGRFVPYPDRVGGACASRPGQHLVVAMRRTAEPDVGRAILYGVADRTVSSIALESAGGSRRVPIAPDGVFLHVARGAGAFRGVTLVTRIGGRERRSPLRR